jgi:sigma-B regulation protein RsbU (phosphoserine phosphatase)
MRSIHRKRARNWILLALTLLDIVFVLTGTMSAVALLLTLALVSYGLILLVRLALRHSKLIWRLRNRLIVTYVFIGVVPIVLILVLAFFGTWIVVSSELSRRGGLVVKDGKYYLGDGPLTREVLGSLVPGLGLVVLGKQVGGQPPEPMNSFDFDVTWFNNIDAVGANRTGAKQEATLKVSTRPSAVLSVVFADRIDAAQDATIEFVLIALLLAAVELGSVAIGVTMTRTITTAVQNLYEGTLRIGKGDFSHRIPVKGRDQLAALGHSFNQMSAQLASLVTVTKEKERLLSELSIASEVQNQLFPRDVPPLRTIELIGACLPARSVSGDYYDYLTLPNGNLAIAIGDVAGKGISAALLMASIQSIMRTQLAQGLPMLAAAGGGRTTQQQFSTAAMVSQLNRQLYANTSPEKYATFFFGLYDEHSRVLTYTNAGHLPPIVICGGEPRPLEVTGTVVGLFPGAGYEEQSVVLCPDDMLIGYTDGITEPENAYGEEFGVDRLSEAVLRHRNCEPCEIVAKVMESVKHWSNAPELPDDMTVLIAKGIR